MFKWFYRFRIGILHATFHRNLKRAESARNLKKFEATAMHIYKAEDAWRKIVILTEKLK